MKNVRYLRENDLNIELEAIAGDLAHLFKASKAAEALFLKRLAFKHEFEVRAFVYSGNGAPLTTAGIKLTIDPHALIQSILIDPRAPEAYVKAFRHYFIDKLKFKGTVLKSKLYSQQTPLEVA